MIEIIDTLKPKNNGDFPIVEAADVATSNSQRLPAALDLKADKTETQDLQIKSQRQSHILRLKCLAQLVMA